MNEFFNKPLKRRDFLRLNLKVGVLFAISPLGGSLAQRLGEAAGQITGLPGLKNSILPGSSGTYSPLTLLAANRLTFGAQKEDLDWIETNGVDAFIDQQLAYEKIDDSALAPRLKGLNTLKLTAGSPIPPVTVDALSELQQATLLRAVYSKRQLFELMVDFWTNHFNINSSFLSDFILKTVDDREVIRKYALGNFRELLGASAHSPAMLGSYEINTRFKMNPNEYWARELLESQTIGVNSGYTDQDVSEIARAFTGWVVTNQVNLKPIIGKFDFLPANHDWGRKTFLGQRLPDSVAGDGEKDGENVLDILAATPACATFISTKLAQRFVSDNPPPSVVGLGAAAFQNSHGDIRATLGAILHSPEFKNSAGLKMKRPFEYVVSALRILNAETDGSSSLHGTMEKMGQPLFLWDKPGGYPDSADAWMNTGDLLARWNFAKAITENSINGTRVDLNALTSQQGDVVANLAQALLARNLPGDVATALQPIADANNFPQLAAVLLGSPLFQLRS